MGRRRDGQNRGKRGTRSWSWLGRIKQAHVTMKERDRGAQGSGDKLGQAKTSHIGPRISPHDEGQKTGQLAEEGEACWAPDGPRIGPCWQNRKEKRRGMERC